MTDTQQQWLLDAAAVARISGKTHDLGKNNEFFQRKIQIPGRIGDPVRHEWLSACMFDAIAEKPGRSLADAFDLAARSAWSDCAKPRHDRQAPALLGGGVKSMVDAVRACVLTHHIMPGEDSNAQVGGPLTCGVYCRSLTGGERSGIDENLVKSMAASYPAQVEQTVVDAFQDMAGARAQTPDYWRAVTLYARCALILADQFVSSQHGDGRKILCMDGESKPYAPFANSERPSSGAGKPHMKQSLQWHLDNVGSRAEFILGDMLRLGQSLPALSAASIASIDAPASGRYSWQEDAAQAVSAARAQNPAAPMLLHVVASTGAGKTRACARMAVRAAVGGRVRLSALFNLRTLTLQTGASYRKDLGLGDAELAVVVGDAMSRAAFEATQDPTPSKTPVKNEDASDGVSRDAGGNIKVVGPQCALPPWLKHIVGDSGNLNAMIGAPVFVSTADYMVSAADPTRKALHIMPLLRLMSSDLILDEIDNYTDTAIVAMLRLVHMAGMMGRNVIVSSATLPVVLAEEITRYFEHGVRLRATLHACAPEMVLGVVSDLAGSDIRVCAEASAFSNVFAEHVKRIGEALKDRAARAPAPRRAFIQPIDMSAASLAPKSRSTGAFNAFTHGIVRAIGALHANHAWTDPVSGKPVSVGLVRVANIRTARRLARALRRFPTSGGVFVVCYHSQLFHGHRLHIERALDAMLNRKSDSYAPARHEAVRAAIDASGAAEKIRFIVVATPVEEVGRDHDFDWAVIEPSSVQSIVQTAGRVNRHRCTPVDHPNIAILERNLRALENGDDKPAFCFPGNEPHDAGHGGGQGLYPEKSMVALLDVEMLGVSLDARLRFDAQANLFARLDDAAIERELLAPRRRLLNRGPNWSALQSPDKYWLSSNTYRLWPLRDKHQVTDPLRYEIDENGDGAFYRVEASSQGPKGELRGGNDPEVLFSTGGYANPTCWLTPSPEQIRAAARDLGIDEGWALSVDVRRPAGGKIVGDENGFYRAG